MTTLLSFGIIIIVSAMILFYPSLGLAVIVSALPLVDILPNIPFVTSLFPVFGGLTLFSYFLNSLRRRDNILRQQKKFYLPIFVFFAAFIVWFSLTAPRAAFLPDLRGRIWLSTYIQLFILLLLAAISQEKVDSHYSLFVFFTISSVVSAIYAILNGNIGESVSSSIRSAGLAGGENSASRYFVIGLVFIYELILRSRKTQNRIVTLIIYILGGILIWGTFATVSRTGILLLLIVGFLEWFLNKRERKSTAIILSITAFFVIWFLAGNIISIASTILPSIPNPTDTVELRYDLWQAAIRMWETHPILGVGIGKFPVNLPYYSYGLSSLGSDLEVGAHNMYLQILAETGVVGLVLFCLSLVFALISLWQYRSHSHGEYSAIAQTWLIALIVILVGGITKHDQYDKFLWLIIGISAGIKNLGVQDGKFKLR